MVRSKLDEVYGWTTHQLVHRAYNLSRILRIDQYSMHPIDHHVGNTRDFRGYDGRAGCQTFEDRVR
jgi:hypothetical protein